METGQQRTGPSCPLGGLGLLGTPPTLSSAGTPGQVLRLSALRLLLFKLLLLDVLLTCGRLCVLADQLLLPPRPRKSLPPTHRIWT